MQSLLTARKDRQAAVSRRFDEQGDTERHPLSDVRTLIVDLYGDLGGDYLARDQGARREALLVTSDDPQERRFERSMTLAEFNGCGTSQFKGISSLVLFLPRRVSEQTTKIIDRCAAVVAQNSGCSVCLVADIRVYFGDNCARAVEEAAVSRFKDVGGTVTTIRTGNVMGDGRAHGLLRWFAPFHPLVPQSIRSVFLSGAELSEAIDSVTGASPAISDRRITLLGANRALKEVLAEYIRPTATTRCLTLLATMLSWLQIGRIAGLLVAAAGHFSEPWQMWTLTTLRPCSVRELLGLCHSLNQHHIALAGHNTGVTHFGWRLPGKTVVQTTGYGRLVRIHYPTVDVDAGVLLKRVITELSAAGKELYVVPNYSYISMGTTFMVPVHGSGSEVSTLGDTIEQALIYDPAIDKIRLIRRGDNRFDRCMYNPASGILVLRLRLRIRDQSRYFVKREQLRFPTADDLWRVFADPDASNIEIRKPRATDSTVEISRYYTSPTSDRTTLEIPRDSLGRLWDRLEENRVTSWLFHTYVRKCGFHVELFLNEEEFDVFWKSHTTLPLSKMQLRLVRRDGLTHSPFGDTDRISADLFMKRTHSAAFLSFVNEHLPNARFNPGKHSL